MASDPEFIRIYNGYTIQRNVGVSDPGDPRYWWWEITNPAQGSLPFNLKGYWTALPDLLNAIRPGRHYS